MVRQADTFIILPNEQTLNYVKTELNPEKLTDLSIDTELYFDSFSRRLATPWQVAEVRTQFLNALPLAEGHILDPACGAGIQLAALGNNLGREVIGIEIDEFLVIDQQANLKFADLIKKYKLSYPLDVKLTTSHQAR